LQDTILVLRTTTQGPAEKAGVKAGDKILCIDGEMAYNEEGEPHNKVKALRGKRGTSIVFSLLQRDGTWKDVEVKRDWVKTSSISAHYIASPGVGYIKMDKFAANSVADFKDAWQELKKNGAKSLIIDLTENGGGYLQTALDLADEFLEKDELITYTDGVNSGKTEYKAGKKGSMRKVPLVLMVNEKSISASEVLAGALQDNDRAFLVGRRTYGKGLVQNTFKIGEGAVRITTGRYYSPSGRCIQRSYSPNDQDAYFNDVSERYKSGEVFGESSFEFDESQAFFTKKGRKVYAGGGILPDLMVYTDTFYYSSELRKINSQGLIFQFAVKLFSSNFDTYAKQGTSLPEYLKNEQLKTEEQFVLYAQSKDIESIPNQSKPYILQMVNATLIRYFLGESEMTKFLNETNPIFIQALNYFNTTAEK
jgi:carboxyl-terminal processing protease